MNVPLWFVVTCFDGAFDHVTGPFTQDYALDVCPGAGHADRHCYVTQISDMEGEIRTHAALAIAEYIDNRIMVV